MTPTDLLFDVIDPALGYLHEEVSDAPAISDEARVIILAISGQEGAFKERRQIGGPARSYWQFESGGGVAGVMGHTKTGPMLRALCSALDIPYDRPTIFEAMAWNDRLGCAMARFLLFTDAAALPKVGDQEGAWNYYLRNWRPGKPHHARWGANYQAAMKSVLSDAEPEKVDTPPDEPPEA